MKRQDVNAIIIVMLCFIALPHSAGGDDEVSSWRVKVLDDSTAGTGLTPASPRETLFASWQVKAPGKQVPGGQFSLVGPAPGPWRVWCNRSEKGELVWHIETIDHGRWTERKIHTDVPESGWLDVEVVMEPRAMTFQCGGLAKGRFHHDGYAETFKMVFGSKQTQEGSPEVSSEYRQTSLQTLTYPYRYGVVPDGPEDVRPEDDALCFMVNPATPQSPRQGEGDLIERKDGSLLIVWSDWYDGRAQDHAPNRISARVSTDEGKNWGQRWTVVQPAMPYPVLSTFGLDGPPPGCSYGEWWTLQRDGAVQRIGGPSPRHPSLLRTRNGDLIMTCVELLPDMKKQEGLSVRRSTDDGQTWSEPKRISPDNDNAHLSNCACLRMLSTGRIILSCREYVSGIRWPYCLYSEDDGNTWQAGQHVPDPELPPEQKRGQNVNEPSVAELTDGRLLMTMRSIAGGQFFSYSSDGGETWTKPYLSPLRGVVSPAAIRRIPGTDDVLAIWNYGYAQRGPLVSAISGDGGKTWRHLKLVEQSQYHCFNYTSITFVGDKVYLTYYTYPHHSSRQLFACEKHEKESNVFSYHDQRLTVLPVKWFYRDAVLESR